jgi:hypothetical protein
MSPNAQAIADAVNLTTLIRWGARYQGTFTIGCEETKLSDGMKGREETLKCWRVIVLRRSGTPTELDGVVFNGVNADISKIVAAAAAEVRRTPEWRVGVEGENMASAREAREERGRARRRELARLRKVRGAVDGGRLTGPSMR